MIAKLFATLAVCLVLVGSTHADSTDAPPDLPQATTQTAASPDAPQPDTAPEPAHVVEQVATSATTFAVCKTLDIATTAYALSHGLGVEANPVIASVLSHGYVPLIAMGVLIWWLLDRADDPVLTTVVNVATCGAAINNLVVIL